MQFFPVTTALEYTRRMVEELSVTRQLQDGLTSDRFDYYRAVRERDHQLYYTTAAVGTTGSTRLACLAERTWYDLGKPYYKVYPHMASMMSEVSIDIPAETIQLPYPSFAIILADDQSNDLYEGNGPKLKWGMVHQFTAWRTSNDNFKISNNPTLEYPGGAKAEALYLNFEFEGRHNTFEPIQFHYVLPLDRPLTAAELINKDWHVEDMQQDYPDEYVPSKEMYERMIKLAIATCFFGIDRHEVVMPDLPRKKIEQKVRAHGAKAAEVIRKEHATTRKWMIGREISLPRPVMTKTEGESVAKRGLTQRYIRRGHMRYQVCGVGRKDRKLLFIHPHFCGDENLPLKNHGYKIPDPK